MGASPIIRKLPGALLLVPAFTVAAAALTSDSANEVWPEFDFYIKLNEKSRIYALYTATRPENLGAYADGQTGVHIDFWVVPPLRKRLIQYVDQSRSKC